MFLILKKIDDSSSLMTKLTTIRHFLFDFFANRVQQYKLERKHDLQLICFHLARSRLRLLIRLTRSRIDEMSRLRDLIYSIYIRCEDLSH